MNRNSAKKKKKEVSSPEAKKKHKEQRSHKASIRGIFSNIGFTRLDLASQKKQDEIIGTDLDDLFVKGNLVCIVEYTTTSSEKEVMDHFRKKHDFYETWQRDLSSFHEKLRAGIILQNNLENFPNDPVNEIKFVFLYASYSVGLSENNRSQYGDVVFFDYNHVKYFELTSKIIREDSIHEFLEYMNIDSSEYSAGNDPKGSQEFEGYILSEKHTKLAKGMHIVSFYISPEELLKRAYVLRKHSWQDKASSPYQRFLDEKKIKKMRDYLSGQERVYVNNIITSISEDSITLSMRNSKGGYDNVSLDEKGQLIDDGGKLISSKSDPIFKIKINNDRNIIGIIDGQHRVYSYHKGKDSDKNSREINKLRNDHCLLVTGVIMPKNKTREEQEGFEANLFLEINEKQTKPKNELIMQIESRAKYRAAGSIALRVVEKLAQRTPLLGVLVRFWYDGTNKIGTSSLVSYVLKALVDPQNSRFYSMWQQKEKSQKKIDELVLDEIAGFEDYCSSQIAIFLSALKGFIDSSEKWEWKKYDKRNPKRFLKVVSIGGMINCLKEFLASEPQVESFLKDDGYFDAKKFAFNKIDDFNFLGYSGSNYAQMGKDMHQFFFSQKRGK